LSSLDLQKLYNKLKTSGRIQTNHALPNPGLSAKTVRSIHIMLSSCLSIAVNERLIPNNPAHGCNIPPKEKREMKIIPPEQIGKFLAEADKAGYLAMFYLELTSGLRRGELLALLWSDVDVTNSTISVSKQVIRVNGELKVLPPKTKNAVRKIVLPRETIDLLKDEHERHLDHPLLFPSPMTAGHLDPKCGLTLELAIGRRPWMLWEPKQISHCGAVQTGLLFLSLIAWRGQIFSHSPQQVQLTFTVNLPVFRPYL